MKDFFDALIGLEHVNGALILDEEGQTVYDPFELSRLDKSDSTSAWSALIRSDIYAKEMDLVFETGRLYIRKIHSNYLLVFMDPEGSAASLTLTCDLYEPQLEKPKPGKKFFKLFF